MGWTPSASDLAVVGAIGDITSAFGQSQEGEQKSEAYDYNANILEQNAATARAKGELQEYQKRKEIRSVIGKQAAGYASAGVTMRGSPVDVMVESLSNAYFDIAIDKYNTEVAARGYENQAKLQRYYGEQTKKAAKTSSAISLLKTVSSVSSKFATAGNSGKKTTIGEGNSSYSELH